MPQMMPINWLFFFFFFIAIFIIFNMMNYYIMNFNLNNQFLIPMNNLKKKITNFNWKW
uniref:ATP synthase complex subunit 8 n=1 Tax=Andraca olivacea TaxID=2219246 RepID=A0A344A0W2_9NEOP|nr:ATP synthase F0 subunit 8 [Andraca olivacea]AWT58362.1 ATP synthase F0 subunit 8 [Andraca olivacea]AWT58375.1 ATP synthase F0 subunit 8 [Andraca olivacea]WGO62250.1 ATP synthase F0 subunit 8 [Andraca olivacea]